MSLFIKVVKFGSKRRLKNRYPQKANNLKGLYRDNIILKTSGHMSQTFSNILPVPKTKPASVLPIPVANWPNAPALQV